MVKRYEYVIRKEQLPAMVHKTKAGTVLALQNVDRVVGKFY